MSGFMQFHKFWGSVEFMKFKGCHALENSLDAHIALSVDHGVN